MKREAVFSKSPRPAGLDKHAPTSASPANSPQSPQTTHTDSGTASSSEKSRLPSFKSLLRWDFLAVFLLGAALSLFAVGIFSPAFQARSALTQKDIDAAVLHT